MKVIATAGHVDHGKSTLIQALTGIDPDRLQEEKQRGMTIDLGFAWLSLPNGEPVGIVDVPGHIDFIKNMVAGVGAVDAALLVVAADEGVMPQTHEHLAVLDLLAIPRGVVALTKIDLVEEEGWLELVQADLREELDGASLADAPIVPVSAITGEGLDALLQALADTLALAPAPSADGPPRLFIDRAFSMAGFGTVVTGTLREGALHVGDEIIIEPGGMKARIRGLQSHKQRIETALPGSRVAVNLTGLHPRQLYRGQVLTTPGRVKSSKRVDVRLRAWEDAPAMLRHNMEISFHSGSAETIGKLRLLEGDELLPGEETWAQIELRDPVAVIRGDRFIIRRPSPSATLGGGVIVDPAPRRRHKRRRLALFRRFDALLRNDPMELTALIIAEQGPISPKAVGDALQLSLDQVEFALADLRASGDVWSLAEDLPEVMNDAAWDRIVARMQRILQAYHEAHPAWLGMPRDALKGRLEPRDGWSVRIFNAVIERALAQGLIREDRGHLAWSDFYPRFSLRQQAAVDELLARFHAQPYTPPSLKQALEIVDDETLTALLQRGDLVRVGPNVLFLRETYDDMLARTLAFLEAQERITVAQCRDLFGASRKYILAFLEHLDRERITRREGDYRVLARK
ncbi:MAG TPA: selenocysteine-specific translation elongation factor [Caldilineales bacterium]|nr:selenocysteine-specific translation elongation factor [Caldilineales bacterium]